MSTYPFAPPAPRTSLLALALLAGLGAGVDAQTAAHAARAVAASDVAALHMRMTPKATPTAADSARAASVARALREALAPYRDTTAAVADGYRMFAPQMKEQKVYHFTNGWRAVQEAFRFDPAKPTSLLYKKAPDGRFVLIGAMYTAPRRFGAEKLDERVPLSIARWHRHVNWCMPKRGEQARWLERQDGIPVFGPESPIASKETCELVGGTFRENLFGWMIHANVLAGDDPAAIWGDDHAGHDMHAAMAADEHHPHE